MFQKDMTPLTKGGSTKAHKGKGSSQAGMPDRHQINSLATAPGAALNNYSKATPMAQPNPAPTPMPGGAPPMGMAGDGI
jgi:hypothetical protein